MVSGRSASLNSSDRAGERRDSVDVWHTEPMKCPHCNQEIGMSTAALADHAFLLRARCEKCGKEFLIVDGVAMTDEQYSSHLPP